MGKRAHALCQSIRESGGAYPVNVEWTNSRTWGYCPRILRNGEKVAYAGGCGYDKLSSVLAEALRWLGDTDEQHAAIWQAGGTGESGITRALAAAGWTLSRTATGSSFDCFTVSRKGAE